MTQPFDPSKFRKGITKSIDGIASGFYDPDTWVDTGSYALNYLISGDFRKGVPMGKVTTLAGESGAGKSFIASGNLVRNAQQQGIFVVLLDSENALDEKWLQALGVDTSEDKLLRIGVSMIDDVARIISDFVKEFKTDYGHLDKEERPKVMFVVDSLGMLLTPTDVAQFEKGDMKGDLGRKAKSLTALVRNAVNQIARWDIGLVCTNHTYASQDMFDPDDKISGGCLTAGHEVRMHDGSVCAIQDVRVGDLVQTVEGHGEVEEVFQFDDREVFELTLETGEKIQATGQHRFLVETSDGDTAWKRVDQLEPEDEILRIH